MIAAILGGGFLISSLLLNLTNTLIIFLHIFGFFLIFQGVRRFAFNKKRDESRAYWTGVAALLFSAAYLGMGLFLCIHVSPTTYTINTDKNISPVKIAMFADSHVGTTFDGDGFAKHMLKIMENDPDIVLVVGDFVDDDTSPEDMKKACEALGKMNPGLGVFYAYGNHDKGFYDRRGYTGAELEYELRKNGVHVLEDEIEYVGDLYIIGRKDGSFRRSDPDGTLYDPPRYKTMDALMEGVDTSKYVIVLDHIPSDYDNESKSAADLVLSGHTHGGQFIPFNRAGELFGLSDMVYGHKNINGTDFIVTSGISDWALLFKTGTKSEYVLINVE